MQYVGATGRLNLYPTYMEDEAAKVLGVDVDELDVMSRQVVESADGRGTDRGVSPVLIVEVHPAGQGFSSFGL